MSKARDEAVEAAFHRGREYSSTDILAANAWFKAAASRGGLDVVLRVIDLWEREPPPEDPGLVNTWKRRAGIAEFPRADAPYIRVALSTFARIIDGHAVAQHDRSLIVQSHDPAVAAQALSGATRASMRDNPSLRLSPVSTTEFGPTVAIEAQDLPFSETHELVHAIVSALSDAGVTAAYIRPTTSDPWLPAQREADPTFTPEVAVKVREAAGDPSGEAAIEVGRWCHDQYRREAGDAWFAHAAVRTPIDTVWRVIDYYALEDFDWNGERLTQWMDRAWRAEFPRVDAPGIHVPSNPFPPIVLDECAGYGHRTAIVVRSADPAAAALALDRAAATLGRITADGRVLTSLDGAPDTGWQDYTPNYVSEIESVGGHPSLWMDWKDMMAPRMARTMTHVIVNELRDAGVVRAWITARATT